MIPKSFVEYYGDHTRWFLGTVVDVFDPLKLGRVKVKVHGVYDEIKDKDLPWAQPMYPLNNSKSFSAPELGEWIVGFFTDGMSGQAPIMMGVLPGLQQ